MPGADDALIQRLDPKENVQQLKMHLDGYARRGLRTLVCAYREVEPTEFDKWRQTYLEAKAVTGVARQVL